MTWFPVAVLGFLVTACSGGGSDSILTTDLPTWTLSAEPTTVLADDGSAATMFTNVQTARLPNGDLLVADRGSKELRVFRDGALFTTLSRQGDGPGELQDLSRIAVNGDTIVVIPLPMVSREVSTFTASGGFVSRRRLRPSAGGPAVTPIGLLTSGEFLVEEGRGGRAFNEIPPLGELIPDSVTIGLLRQPGSDSVGAYQPLGRWLRWSMVAHRVEGLPIPFNVARVSLAPMSHWTASGPLVWLADGATGAVQAFDGTGAQVVNAQLPLGPRTLDLSVIRRSRDLAMAGAATALDSAAADASHAAAFLTQTMPVLDAVQAGHDGELWVRLFALESGPTREYLVVNPSGETVARVAVPSELIIHQIGADFILGVRRDVDGIETVVEYALRRGGTP